MWRTFSDSVWAVWAYVKTRLFRDRWLSLATISILGLCVGINVVVYTVVGLVFYGGLPFDRPDELVTAYDIYPLAGADSA